MAQGVTIIVVLSKAFDGVVAQGNHYTALVDIDNPWISGDIGTVKIIAGAKYWTSIGCCAGE